MEIEGFTIDDDLEEAVRKMLTGETKREDYYEALRQKAQRYAEV